MIAFLVGLGVGLIGTALLAWKIWTLQDVKWHAEVELLETEIAVLRQKVNLLEGRCTARRVEL